MRILFEVLLLFIVGMFAVGIYKLIFNKKR